MQLFVEMPVWSFVTLWNMREFNERRAESAGESETDRARRIERNVMRGVIRAPLEAQRVPEVQTTEDSRIEAARKLRMERLRVQRLHEGDEGQSREHREDIARPHFLRVIDDLLAGMRETHQNWNMFESRLATREVYEASRASTGGLPENFSAWQTMVFLISLKIQGAVKRRGFLPTRRMLASVHSLAALLQLS